MRGVVRRGNSLLLPFLLALAASLLLPAQKPVSLTISVIDKSGAAIAGASIQEAAGQLLGRTDTNGQLTVHCRIPCHLHVTASGFAEKFVDTSANITVQLDPAATSQQVTVTAYRAPIASLESPVTTRTLSQSALSSTAGFTVDAQVRQLPGVELFRRSSSLVANPTSQGVSLRGLGSTSASRTLVTQDDVPLNDAVGGWIHWEEEPELAIDRIEVLRGGASDLYGSSAIGGVLNIVPVRPSATTGEFRSSYGGLGTYNTSALLETKLGAWGILGSGGALGTNGFIQLAPSQRGPIDTSSNMHGQNGILELDHGTGPLRLLVRGSGFNEARDNGTPYQKNGTRLWRYATGADWQAPHNATAALRLYGSTEHYRQTFSSISNTSVTDPTCTARCSESPTRFTLVPANELGAAAHWSRPIGAEFLILAGADVHDVRVWDRERVFSTGALSNTHDHQRDSAGYAEAMWTHHAWTATASNRLDWFQNYDAHQVNWNGTAWVPAATQPPSTSEHIFDPRLGLSRKLGSHFALSGSGFRAFRAPTPSELYRSTQVGSKLTLPNSSLLSERATGWEFGLASEWHWGTIRTSYFDTQVNRPIVAVTLDPSSPLLLKRQNLGQIESRGLSLDFEVAPRRWLALDGGYQYAHAVVSRGSQDLGNWIPEVARNMGTVNLRAFKPRLGTLSLQSRVSGRQYDDDANLFALHGYFRLDAYASHDFGPHLQLFAAAENLFDRSIEVSKTPSTTLATPRLARAGLQLQFGGAK
ncbi:MAG TPA: TonB-dependent receptor [Terracidiphilus sp.]|nr:TonB-dependent receptor [Terracidiphilus sp.]